MENAKLILAGFIGIIFVLDTALAGGYLVIKPSLNLIIYQNLEGTIWKCQDWIVMDEGQFCGDE